MPEGVDVSAPRRPSPTSSESAHRRADIQGLRAVAVVLVVLFHAGIGPRAGFLGVDVFFVISGFVIAGSLARELDRTGGVGVAAFYGRRVRRLLPALATMTVVTALASAALLNPYGAQRFALRTGAAASTFVANLYLYRHTGYFDGSAELNPFLHTWSLSVEEQFFLALPVVVGGAWWLARRTAPGRDRIEVARWAVAVLGALSAALAWVMVAGPSWLPFEAPARLAFFAMPTRVWEFCAGVLVALWRQEGAGSGAAARTEAATAPAAVPALGLVAVVVAAVAMRPSAPDPGIWTLLAVLGACAVVVPSRRSAPAVRVLGTPALVWIGDRSYSWYLWHWPAIVFARVIWPERPWVLVAAAILSLLPAVWSHQVVEQPFRTRPRWRGSATVRLGAACVVVPLLVIGALTALARTGLGVVEPMGWYDYPPSQGTSCHIVNRDAPDAFEPASCTWGPTDADGLALVVGDEVANGVVPAVIDVAGDAGMRTLQWTRAGCPFVVGPAPPDYPRCAQWRDDVQELIRDRRPDVVVVANQSVDHVDGDRPSEVARWQQELGRTVDTIERAGAVAVVVGPLPDFGERFPRERMSALQPDPPTPVLGRAEVDDGRRSVVAAERSAVAARPSARYLDPIPALCGTTCTPRSGEVWQYLDRLALTNEGAALLRSGLTDAFAERSGRAPG